MNYLELIGTLLGIFGVYLSYKDSYWGFIIGLGNTFIYVFICWQAKLYGECFLNVFYSLMNILGWIKWLRKTPSRQSPLHITYCSLRQWCYSLILFFFIWFFIYILLRHYTDSPLPLIDSFTVSGSYVAMGLLVLKKIDNWLWWIVVNVASIILFYYKGLSITSIQYLVLLVIAVIAYRAWNKKIRTPSYAQDITQNDVSY